MRVLGYKYNNGEPTFNWFEICTEDLTHFYIYWEYKFFKNCNCRLITFVNYRSFYFDIWIEDL